MKAIRIHQFGGPEVLSVEEVPVPVVGAGQVLVAMKAVGVNPVEVYIRNGIYGPREFPFTPGSDGAGIVEKSNSERFKVGDRVYTAGTISGAYAQFALCGEKMVHSLPANATFAQGAALGVPCATAYQALVNRGKALAGETLLVHGASGAVGLAVVQLAHALGLKVIGTAGSKPGRELVLAEGAHHVLDHHDSAHFQELMRLTGGKGVDLILEMLANVNLGTDLTVLGRHGRVVVVGSRGPVQIDAREMMKRDADIRGMTLNNATEADLHQIHSALGVGLENKTLRPIIDVEIPLGEAARAQQLVMEGESKGKIVLVP